MKHTLLFLLSASTGLAQLYMPAAAAAQVASVQQPAAQVSAAPESETDGAARSGAGRYKDLRFGVVSIRRNKGGGPQIIGRVTPDGFEMRNMFFGAAIATAYVPTDGSAARYSQVVWNAGWLTSDDDRYDVDAKVDETDLPDWRDPAKQPAMLRAMLQNMLADRLRLKVHESSKEERTYALVVAGKAPRFKESVPGDAPADGWPNLGGGVMTQERKDGWVTMRWYGISMGQIANMLSPEGRPAQDRTGLTGKYDVTLVEPESPGAGTPEVRPIPVVPEERAEQLGLKLVPSRGVVETLVIDHVELPSED